MRGARSSGPLACMGLPFFGGSLSDATRGRLRQVGLGLVRRVDTPGSAPPVRGPRPWGLIGGGAFVGLTLWGSLSDTLRAF